MSDGSCQAGDQAPAQPTAGAPAQNNAPQSTAPQQQDQQPQQYAAAPAPPAQQYSAPPQDQSSDNDDSDVYDTNPYADQTYQQDAYNDGYQQGYDAAVQASEPPPELPVYAQPACPDVGYIWNPGYWSWGQYGYYWVPGVWVLAPYTGALWTPPWWGFFGGHYRWHHGYWGSHVGFYGGIPYGYGYTGQGYHGGYWDHDRFMYNRSVTNINSTHITNVYNVRVVNVVNNRVSYNGGRGGLNVRPTPSEFAAMREPHVRPLPAQVQHRTQAAQNRQQYVRFNGGKPAALAAPRPIQTRPVHVAPTVVNPGVHGATRPAPAVARPAPGTRPTTTAAPARPNQPVTRPGRQPTPNPLRQRDPARRQPIVPLRGRKRRLNHHAHSPPTRSQFGSQHRRAGPHRSPLVQSNNRGPKLAPRPNRRVRFSSHGPKLGPHQNRRVRFSSHARKHGRNRSPRVRLLNRCVQSHSRGRRPDPSRNRHVLLRRRDRNHNVPSHSVKLLVRTRTSSRIADVRPKAVSPSLRPLLSSSAEIAAAFRNHWRYL